MKFKLIYLLFFLLINNTAYSSYVKGVVTDEDGELLPFATIYVENTTYGVITNSVGEYFLELQEGEYTIFSLFPNSFFTESDDPNDEPGIRINSAVKKFNRHCI